MSKTKLVITLVAMTTAALVSACDVQSAIKRQASTTLCSNVDSGRCPEPDAGDPSPS